MVPEHNNKILQRGKASRMGREWDWEKEGVDRTCTIESQKNKHGGQVYTIDKKRAETITPI